ncbi:MAG: ABC transporter permease, partial [Clostridiales bacterium]
MKKYTGITNKYLKIQKRRTILTITGVILAISLIVTILTLYLSFSKSLIETTKESSGEYHFKTTNTIGELISKVENNNDVEKIGVLREFGTAFVSKVSEKEKKYDPKAPDNRTVIINEINDPDYKLIPIKLLEGRKPENENEIVLEKTAVLFLDEKLNIGDKISLPIMESKYKGKEFNETFTKEYTLVGIKENNILISTNYYSIGFTYLDKENIDKNNFYNVFVKLYSPDNCKEKAQTLNENLKVNEYAKNKNLESELIYNSELLRWLFESENNLFNKNMIIVLLIILTLIIISATVVIYNSFNISVLEKIRQFGILRCIGASSKQIKKIVLKEASIIGAIGIPIGIIIGLIVSKIMLLFLENYASFLKLKLLLDINIYVIILSFLLGIVTIYISAFGPMRQAAKISPVEAVKNTGSIKHENIKKSKNINKFKLIKKIFGIEGQLAYKNLKRNRKRYRITLLSMIISIVLYLFFIGFADLTTGTGETVNEDVGDFYFMLKDSSRNFSDDVIDKIKKIEEIQSVYEIQESSKFKENSIDISLIDNNNANKKDINVISFENDGLRDLKEYIVDGTTDKNELSKNNGVILINTTLIFKNGKRKYEEDLEYKVGDKLKLKVGKDEKELKVEGIVKKGLFYGATYNTENSMLIMTNDKTFKYIFNESKINGLVIKSKDKNQNKIISSKFTKLIEKYPEYEFISFGDNANNIMRILIVMKIFLYGFIIIVSIISILNIIN